MLLYNGLCVNENLIERESEREVLWRSVIVLVDEIHRESGPSYYFCLHFVLKFLTSNLVKRKPVETDVVINYSTPSVHYTWNSFSVQ